MPATPVPDLAPEPPKPWWRRSLSGLLVVGAFLLKFGKAALLLIPKAKLLTTSGTMLVSLAAYSQTDTASIVGTVIDNSGAVLPNVVVTIVNVGTNAKTVVKTGSDGNYVATPLKIGNYSVAVEAQGFKGITHTGIVLNA